MIIPFSFLWTFFAINVKVHWVSFLRLSGEVRWEFPQAVSHSSSWPVAMLWPMGMVPPFPIALAVVSHRHAGVGSSNHAAHGGLASSHSWLPLYSCAVFYEPIFSFAHELVHLSLWLDTGWCIFVTHPGAEAKPRPSDERVGFWPRGHQGRLWLRLSRCWKGLICLGERGLAAVSRAWDTTPWGCLCKGSSCARQGKRNEMQLLRPVASSALPLLNTSQKLLQLWKTCF